MLHHGINPIFYESGFAAYYRDAVFSNEELDAFHPDIVYICTSRHNIEQMPSVSDSEKRAAVLLDEEYARFEGMWESLENRFHCPIIQNNFELPSFRLLGNRDCSDLRGAVHFLSSLNMQLAAYAQAHEDFFICDINYLSACYGLDAWSEPSYWYLYKYALCVPAIPLLAHNIANIIKSIFGKNKKALVLDLDNTLWGGVISDDGVEHIEIGPESAAGQRFQAFQKYISDHRRLGVMLAIASKNDYANAVDGLNHPSGVLRPDDFVKVKANWEPKSQNILEIADELHIFPESLVFVDDNPAEQCLVSEQVPGVAVPQMAETEDGIKILDRSGFFEVTYLTADDAKRAAMYQENKVREQMRIACGSYEEYLRSLEMTAVAVPFEDIYMARISQLVNKSNQFNLTTRRYTLTEIQEIAENPQFITLYGVLRDRFGDNGLVTVLIGRQEGQTCCMELWLMSCRVLQRNLEYFMMDQLVAECQKRTIQRIEGFYKKTAKNQMVAELYGKMGFTKIEEDESGNSRWEYIIPAQYTCKNTIIRSEKEI